MSRTSTIPFLAVERAFIITDIVGSTELVCRLGDSVFQELVDAHDDLLIDLLQRRAGEFIRHRGDGMLVAFADPADAISWSLEARRMVRARLRLTLRIGAHFGPAVPSARGYGGRSLHIAARLAETAAAGEMVASQALLAEASIEVAAPREAVHLRGLDRCIDIVRFGADRLLPRRPDSAWARRGPRESMAPVDARPVGESLDGAA